MIDTALLSDLRTYYHEGRLLPFVGAGVSMSVEWMGSDHKPTRGPSWRELVDQAALMLNFSDPDLLRVRGEDLQILEYFRLCHGNRLAPLTNWLVQHLDVPNDVLRVNPILEALAQLTKCSTIYTTNFDSFVETALRLHGRKVAVVAGEDEIGEVLRQRNAFGSELCEVVKFHGDLEHPDTMVVSERDYRERLALTTPMDDRLKADLLGRLVLFIGYSFRDWNVSYLYHVVNQYHGGLPESPTGRRAYITVSEPSDFEGKLFNARRIGVLPISSGSSATSDVAQLLASLRT